MSLYDKTMREYLKLASSASPTPGGGSVSAVVATSAAAMVGMVARLTDGKAGLEGVWKKAGAIARASDEIILALEGFTKSDMDAFEDFLRALKLPKSTDAEKGTRKDAIQVATRRATEIPLAIAREAKKILDLAEELAPIGNRTAISDVGVAASIGAASVESALLSVEMNLPSLLDTDFRSAILRERAELLAAAKTQRDQTLDVVRERMGWKAFAGVGS